MDEAAKIARGLTSRLVCLFRGHVWTPKAVLGGTYSRIVLDTCDRCGNGERELASAKALAARYLQETTSHDR